MSAAPNRLLQDDAELLSMLRDAAVQASGRSYSPYSGFRVGAAIWTSSGRLFVGSNIENASYGLTLCAERVAMAAACMAGCRDLGAIVVASPGGVAPCGSCRQFLLEFVDDADVATVDLARLEATHHFRLSELLPHRFLPSDLTQRVPPPSP